MLLVDTVKKCVEEDDELKLRIASHRPHKQLMHSRVYMDAIRRDDIVSKWLDIHLNTNDELVKSA